MISLVSSFKIINVPIPDPKIAISVVDAVAANANGIQRLLAYGLSTVPIKDKLSLVMVQKIDQEILLFLQS